MGELTAERNSVSKARPLQSASSMNCLAPFCAPFLSSTPSPLALAADSEQIAVSAAAKLMGNFDRVVQDI